MCVCVCVCVCMWVCVCVCVCVGVRGHEKNIGYSRVGGCKVVNTHPVLSSCFVIAVMA